MALDNLLFSYWISKAVIMKEINLQEYQRPVMFSICHLGLDNSEFSELIGLSSRQISSLMHNNRVKPIYLMGLSYLILKHNEKYQHCDYPNLYQHDLFKGLGFVRENDESGLKLKLFKTYSCDILCDIPHLYSIMENSFIAKNIIYSTFKNSSSVRNINELDILMDSIINNANMLFYANEFQFETLFKEDVKSVTIELIVKRSYKQDDEVEIESAGKYRDKIGKEEYKVAELSFKKKETYTFNDISKAVYMLMLLKHSAKLVRRCHTVFVTSKSDINRNHKILSSMNVNHRNLTDQVSKSLRRIN